MVYPQLMFFVTLFLIKNQLANLQLFSFENQFSIFYKKKTAAKDNFPLLQPLQ